MADVREIRKMAGALPHRRRRVPRQLYPRLIEREYAESIAELSDREIRRAIEPLLAQLPELLASAALSRSDSRLDADEGRRARRLVDQARGRVKSKAGDDRIEATGRRVGKQTTTYQKQQLNRQTRAAMGVDVRLADKGLAAKIEHFVAENVSLISTMQRKRLGEVEAIVTRAIVEGRLHSDVAKDLERRFKVGESHARLIARDQIGKLYGQVNASRQKELGVKRFRWRTVGDTRVREAHKKRQRDSEKKPYRYDAPPNGELPGVPIQCRCTAEPVFDD